MPATKRATRTSAKRAAKRASQRKLSPSHKRALAEGRAMSATVNRYLAAVTTPKRRGRKVSKATLEQRLVTARTRFKSEVGIEKLLAAQEVRDLRAKLKQIASETPIDVKSLEAAFVKVAKTF